MAAPPEAEYRERKRKWGVGAPSGVDEAAHAAAAAAAAAATTLNRRLAGGADKPFREFEINDHPGRRFAMMSANIRTVEAKHGVVIVSKGRFIPPSEPVPPADAPDHERKLFLKIRGETMESVDEAVSQIEGIMAQRGGDAKVWADMDVLSVPHLDVVDRLTGPGGEYLKFIEAETGANVTISGRGSSGDYSGRDNLHLAIKGEAGAVQQAKGLCFSLVKSVRGVYDEYRQRYYGVAPRRQHGSGRWLSGGWGYGNDVQAAADAPPPPALPAMGGEAAPPAGIGGGVAPVGLNGVPPPPPPAPPITNGIANQGGFDDAPPPPPPPPI